MAARLDSWLRTARRTGTCARKRTFSSRKEALAATHRSKSGPLWPYKCDSCHKWHLTSRPPNKEAADKAVSATAPERGTATA